MSNKNSHEEEWKIIGGMYIALSKSKGDIYDIRVQSCERLLDKFY